MSEFNYAGLVEYYKDCANFPDGPDCCGSCHEDEELLNYEMTTLQKDGETAYVCCRMSQYLQSKGWKF